jgi:hypothetical protein
MRSTPTPAPAPRCGMRISWIPRTAERRAKQPCHREPPEDSLATRLAISLLGVTGTPVIDPVTNTIYVVSKSVGSTKFFQLLHALDLTTGNERSHPEASTLPFRLQEPATDR